MNNFIYTHLKPETFSPGYQTNHISKNFIPDYFFKSMYQTRKLNPESRIFMLTDDEIDQKIQEKIGITVVPFSQKEFKDVRLLNEVMQYKGRFRENPFWFITFIRYMLCEYLCDKFSIDSFCFIEGDNLIYFNIDDIIDKYCPHSLAVCNETSPGNYSSGIYFCTNAEVLKKLNDFNLNDFKLGAKCVTDMNSIFSFHNKTKSLTILPALPDDTKDNLLFDPLSCGQFLGGENHRREDSFLDRNHRLYKEMFAKYEYEKDFQLFKGESCFKLRFFDREYDLFNIHAHNKANFDKFFIFNEQYQNEVIG